MLVDIMSGHVNCLVVVLYHIKDGTPDARNNAHLRTKRTAIIEKQWLYLLFSVRVTFIGAYGGVFSIQKYSVTGLA